MLDEKLSALVDDELDAAEADALISRVMSEPEMRQDWSRQHLVRAALRDQVTQPLSDDFASQVMSAIEQEGAPEVSRKVVPFKRPQWRPAQWATGLAMAASVAAVAFVLSFNLAPTADTGFATAGNQDSSTQRVAFQRAKANAEAQRELQQHLLDHEALARGHGLNSQRRYMRMASPSTTYVAYTPE